MACGSFWGRRWVSSAAATTAGGFLGGSLRIWGGGERRGGQDWLVTSLLSCRGGPAAPHPQAPQQQLSSSRQSPVAGGAGQGKG